MSPAISTPLLTFPEARQLVEGYAKQVSPSEPEMLPLLEGLGLVLAEDLHADRDFPPFPRATRDGYAVRADDVAALPARLQCVGEIKAGGADGQPDLTIGLGETAEIMTGAPVPAGADAVVMVEYSERHRDMVTLTRSVQHGENVVAAGSEARKGSIVVGRGTRINQAVVAVAAALGRPEVAVQRRPRVAILATGDELVDINLPPGPSQIRNSNTYSLAAQVHAAGGIPVLLPVARDEPDDLAVLLGRGFAADLLLLTGGVSMGKYDLVEPALAALGARFFFTGVSMQPGKPVVFGEATYDGRSVPFFGLPGNPVSTMVTFQLFAQPLIDALSGGVPRALNFAQASLKAEFKTKTGLTRFLPAKLGGNFQLPEVEITRWQGSGDLMAVARSNCYIVVPPDREQFASGEVVTVLLF